MDIRDEIDYLEDRLAMMKDLADTLTEDIEVIEKKIEELKGKLWEEENPKKERWVPELGETVWLIGFDGVVLCETALRDVEFLRLMKIGNYFKTKEEAQMVVDRLKAKEKLLKHGGAQGRCSGFPASYPYYRVAVTDDNSKLFVQPVWDTASPFDITFDNKEDCQKALDSLTEEEKFSLLCEVY